VPLHGIDLHFLHVEGQGPRRCRCCSCARLAGLGTRVPSTSSPRSPIRPRFGGDPADAFTVVAPSLPGYGLSFKPGQPRLGLEAMADCLAELMTGVLGYRRFAAQGGDWGAFITSRLGRVHADKVIGIHLNLLALRRDAKLEHPTPEEKAYLGELQSWLKEETATSGSRARGRRRSPSA
jgi:microsomal epoxide hydrolase